MIRITLFLALIVFSSKSPAQETGSFTDNRDGKIYKIVKIGKQIWMAENLNYAMDKSICYDDSIKNCNKYGRLYNWPAAINSCPVGWHLPSRKEFESLINYCGGTGSVSYHSLIEGGDSGFSAQFAGAHITNGKFFNIEINALLWSSTKSFPGNAWTLSVLKTIPTAHMFSFMNLCEASVRCVKDK